MPHGGDGRAHERLHAGGIGVQRLFEALAFDQEGGETIARRGGSFPVHEAIDLGLEGIEVAGNLGGFFHELPQQLYILQDAARADNALQEREVEDTLSSLYRFLYSYEH